MSGSEIKGPPFSVRQTVANPLEHTMLRASQRPYPQQNWPSPCLHPCEPSNRDPPPNQKKIGILCSDTELRREGLAGEPELTGLGAGACAPLGV